jgi:hypothetical protein
MRGGGRGEGERIGFFNILAHAILKNAENLILQKNFINGTHIAKICFVYDKIVNGLQEIKF